VIRGARSTRLGLAAATSLFMALGGASTAHAQAPLPVDVETRAIPGRDVKEVAARGTIGAPSHVVRAVIADREHYPAFMPYVKESRVLGRDTEGAALNYQRLSFGVPFVDDRHYVIRVAERRHRESDGRASYAFVWRLVDGLPDQVRTGAVRVSVNSGYWALRPGPGSPDATDVRYCVFTDPGGSLPRWIVDMANTEAIPKLFAAVASAATSPRYATAVPPAGDGALSAPLALDRCAEPTPTQR
jgi:Polyketide cyclase / dehydrase and lipid transport